MKTILNVCAAMLVAIGLTACALLQPALPNSVEEKVRIGAEYVFEGFRTAWIPVLSAYRTTLPKCGAAVPQPCWEPSVYKRLYHATDIATACMVASSKPGVPIAEIQLCVSKVEGAKTVFIKEGFIPKGAT